MHDEANVGRWLLLLRDGSEAEQQLARTELGLILEGRGLLDEAAEAFERNVSEGTTDRRPYERLAAIARQRGDAVAEARALRGLADLLSPPPPPAPRDDLTPPAPFSAPERGEVEEDVVVEGESDGIKADDLAEAPTDADDAEPHGEAATDASAAGSALTATDAFDDLIEPSSAPADVSGEDGVSGEADENGPFTADTPVDAEAPASVSSDDHVNASEASAPTDVTEASAPTDVTAAPAEAADDPGDADSAPSDTPPDKTPAVALAVAPADDSPVPAVTPPDGRPAAAPADALPESLLAGAPTPALPPAPIILPQAPLPLVSSHSNAPEPPAPISPLPAPERGAGGMRSPSGPEVGDVRSPDGTHSVKSPQPALRRLLATLTGLVVVALVVGAALMIPVSRPVSVAPAKPGPSPTAAEPPAPIAAPPTALPSPSPSPTVPVVQEPAPSPTVAAAPLAARCSDAALRFPESRDSEAAVRAAFREYMARQGVTIDPASTLFAGLAEAHAARHADLMAGWMAVTLQRERRGLPTFPLVDYVASDIIVAAGPGEYQLRATISPQGWNELRALPADSCEGAFLHSSDNAQWVDLMPASVGDITWALPTPQPRR